MNRRILIGSLTVGFLILSLRVSYLTTSQTITDTPADSASVHFTLQPSIVFYPQQMVEVAWQLEGIQSVFLNENGRIGADKFSEAINHCSLYTWSVTFQDGTTRDYELQPHYLWTDGLLFLIIGVGLSLLLFFGNHHLRHRLGLLLIGLLHLTLGYHLFPVTCDHPLNHIVQPLITVAYGMTLLLFFIFWLISWHKPHQLDSRRVWRLGLASFGLALVVITLRPTFITLFDEYPWFIPLIPLVISLILLAQLPNAPAVAHHLRLGVIGILSLVAIGINLANPLNRPSPNLLNEDNSLQSANPSVFPDIAVYAGEHFAGWEYNYPINAEGVRQALWQLRWSELLPNAIDYDSALTTTEHDALLVLPHTIVTNTLTDEDFAFVASDAERGRLWFLRYEDQLWFVPEIHVPERFLNS